MATTNVGPSQSADEPLTRAECEAALQRVCFGHLAFSRQRHVDVLPTRYAFLDGWVYFRADVELREVINGSPWLVLAVTELVDVTHVTSVVVRGSCHETQDTGSEKGDADALRGIVKLRDRASIGRTKTDNVSRTSTVFRMHCDEIRGMTTCVPCPAGERPYDAMELQHIREAARDHTVSEDERGDDDGMAQPNAPSSSPSSRSSRSRRPPSAGVDSSDGR